MDTITKTEAIRDEIGKLLRKEAEKQGFTNYRLQKAMQRGKTLPPSTILEGVFSNTRDYTIGTLLMMIDALGLELQITKKGRPLLKTPAEAPGPRSDG